VGLVLQIDEPPKDRSKLGAVGDRLFQQPGSAPVIRASVDAVEPAGADCVSSRNSGENSEAGANVQKLIPTMLVKHQFGDLKVRLCRIEPDASLRASGRRGSLPRQCRPAE
jgi:hypothetical protein